MIPTTSTIILLAVLLFVLGLVFGWIFANNTDQTPRGKAKTLVAVAVTLVWITATVADILVAAYTISPLLHALMGAIVGYFFTEEGVNLNIGNSKQ